MKLNYPFIIMLLLLGLSWIGIIKMFVSAKMV